MAEQTTDTAFDQVLEEHRELRDLVAELRAFLEKPRPPVSSPQAPTWAGDLADRLVAFHDKANKHFRAEERSGFLDKLAEARPSATRQVVQLQGEHDRILGDLRSVLEASMVYARNKEPECANLRRWTSTVLDRFDQHERDETDLTQDLICDDYGVGD
jgi:cell division septum initiation protein DivIVA